jgi:RNA polymerase sigma factor (sigma-70 family)
VTSHWGVTELLVAAATAGDAAAWEELVDRYAGLVWSVCRRYRLTDADAADVSQTVWLRTVERLDRLREAGALPGWLVTTTSRECLHALRTARRTVDLDENVRALDVDAEDVAAGVLAAERAAALRAGLANLPPQCQQLIALLVTDPPPSYTDVSSRMGMPVGSIGPTRARCLEKLRRSPALAALMADHASR